MLQTLHAGRGTPLHSSRLVRWESDWYEAIRILRKAYRYRGIVHWYVAVCSRETPLPPQGVLLGKRAKWKAWCWRHPGPAVRLPSRGYPRSHNRGGVLWSVPFHGCLLHRSMLRLGEEQQWTVRRNGPFRSRYSECLGDTCCWGNSYF